MILYNFVMLNIVSISYIKYISLYTVSRYLYQMATLGYF